MDWSLGNTCSDFVAVKTDGDLMVRECVFKKREYKGAEERQTGQGNGAASAAPFF